LKTPPFKIEEVDNVTLRPIEPAQDAPTAIKEQYLNTLKFLLNEALGKRLSAPKTLKQDLKKVLMLLNGKKG
jgi:hypothetical protein